MNRAKRVIEGARPPIIKEKTDVILFMAFFNDVGGGSEGGGSLYQVSSGDYIHSKTISSV